MNVRNDYDGAEAEFRRALELDPSYPWARNNLGLLLFEVCLPFVCVRVVCDIVSHVRRVWHVCAVVSRVTCAVLCGVTCAALCHVWYYPGRRRM